MTEKIAIIGFGNIAKAIITPLLEKKIMLAISLTQLINLVCENPIKIFGIQNKGFIKEGYDADFTIVDMNKKITIKNENIESKCGWSPFNDVEFKGTPVATIISGKIKMRDGKILGEPEGTPLKFS